MSQAPTTTTEVRSLFWRALLIRVVVVVALAVVGATDFFAPDQRTYDSGAASLAGRWAGEVPYFELRRDEPRGYYYIVAALYFFLGRNMMWPGLLNSLLGALLVPLVYDLAVRVGGSPAMGLRAARYTAYFPSLVLWSSLNIRDAWVVLLIALICREAVVLNERFELRTLAGLTAAVFGLTQFRGYLLYAVSLPVVLALMLKGRGNVVRNAAIGALVAIVAVYAEAVTAPRIPDLERLAELRRWSAKEGIAASGFARDVDVSTPAGALAFLPVGLVYFLFAPFPWTIANLRQAFTLPEMLFFYSLVPSMVRGLVHLTRQRLTNALPMLLLTAVVSFAYAIGQGNVGTIYRHRAQVLPFYLILASVGVEVHRKRKRNQAGPPTTESQTLAEGSGGAPAPRRHE
jgi:hypothetical protein